MAQIMEFLRPIQSGLEYIIVFLYNHVVENYGIVIILITIIVRAVLVPLTIGQTKSMAKMQKLQPEINEIQKKYKNDPQKLQQEMMNFYTKNKVNPLSGCFPLLLQMPVFYALFGALRNPSRIVTDVIGNFNLSGIANGIKTGMIGILKGTEFIPASTPNPNYSFLWLNLNEKDPYYILVILMVLTMFLSSKISSPDTKQSKIIYMMPLMFGIISIQLPSGFLLYWVTSNIWTIGQQWVVNKIIKKNMEKDKDEEESEKKGAAQKAGEQLSEEDKKIIKKKLKKKKKKKR
ncbi:MAG: YidC/Oxa1 family membrane protein insertase [Actinomycetota bacterium]|nr:YidC/Oxa1 family membrane protein insertase [Actinomycetota bacterium]